MPPYSQLVVHDSIPAYYDAYNVPHGTVTRHVYHSDVTNGERELYVYTPPEYDREKMYPVLYLVGGSGDLPSNWVYDGLQKGAKRSIYRTHDRNEDDKYDVYMNFSTLYGMLVG